MSLTRSLLVSMDRRSTLASTQAVATRASSGFRVESFHSEP